MKTAVRRSEPAVLCTEIVQRALHPAEGESPDTVADLITMAEGLRPPLEAAQSVLIARLHGQSDDFGATRALCSVSAALNRIGWEMPSAPVRRHRWGGRRS